MKPFTLFQFIVRLLKPYWFYLMIFVLVGIVWASASAVLPYILKIIIDKIVGFQGENTAIFRLIQWEVALYILIWIGLCFMMRLLDWVKLKLFPSLRADVMQQMFWYLSNHAYRYFQKHFAGSLINKIVDMQAGIVEILTILDEVHAQILTLTIASMILLYVHPVFALILLAWAATFLLITFYFLRPISHLAHLFAESRTTLVGRMVDSISNIVTVRLFSSHLYEGQYIGEAIADAVTKDRAMQRKIIVMRILWDMSIVLLLSINLWMLCEMYAKHLVTVGDFSFVITLSVSILWNLWFIAGQFVTFSEQVGKCKQALSVMLVQHELVDAGDASPLQIARGEITFNQVTFNYAGAKDLFNQLSVSIAGGEKVGLVGFSGGGKSTFVSLILRLFEIESGSILIDNQNIQKVTQDSLRQQIALIPQDVPLFHRTLMENIRYGRIGATDEEVLNASKKANCHEFVLTLKDGYQSMVGERGVKLSGGQRQRIAIARAMLKNAPILILDEATSALDSVTEKYIQAALHELMQGKTTVVIAHRLSTLAEMDRILVFDNGQIIEDGTHESLLKKRGHYARLWTMQASGFLPEYS